MSSNQSRKRPPHQFNAGEIMTTRLFTLRPDTDVFDGIDTLVRHRISGAPVVDSEQNLLGVFSEKSCLEVLIDAAYERLPTNRVSAFMDPNPTTITEDTDLLTIAQIFINKRTRRLPVLRDEKLVGQVSRRDVIRAAAKIRAAYPDRESTLLYLSAIRSMQDPPVV